MKQMHWLDLSFMLEECGFRPSAKPGALVELSGFINTYLGLPSAPVTDERLAEIAGEIVDCYGQAPDASEGLEELDLDKAIAILRELLDEALKPRSFEQWKQLYAPGDSGEDYDLLAAFHAGAVPDASGHWPDTFKLPNHPTFSVESIYATGDDAAKAGRWEGDKFIPA